MLADFQQAFADLVASPELCVRMRANPELLAECYLLSAVEQRRLIGLLEHPGMECNCMLYRANRLAPIALNLPGVCKAFGDELRTIMSEYWAAYPHTDVHFMLESRRFCDFVLARRANGREFSAQVLDALEREGALLDLRLRASCTESV